MILGISVGSELDLGSEESGSDFRCRIGLQKVYVGFMLYVYFSV